jgi:glycerol transport system ATP-binding protein
MRLTLENVTKMVREQPYLYDVDLDFASGSFNVLLGPTQAGKTSLLRLMAGLDYPSSGTIREDGADVTLLGVRKRNVAMVYQEFVNYPSFTVYENIAAPVRRAKRLSAAQIDAKVRAKAQMMRIDHLLGRLPSELSGGQQQRVALARALVKEAPLLLLDEPLVNLDYKLREELRSELREILRHGTTTVVYATTEPQEALLFAGNTVVLDAGRVLQSGPALEIYHRPATIRASQVFSDPPINLISAVIGPQGCRLSPSVALPLAQHMLALPPGDYRVGVRADHIGLLGHVENGCLIRAKVELAEINGSETYVHAGHGDFQIIAVLQGVHEFGLGDEISLYLDPRRLFVFDGAGAVVAAPEQNAGRRGAHEWR